jgi:hypothetical protein
MEEEEGMAAGRLMRQQQGQQDVSFCQTCTP